MIASLLVAMDEERGIGYRNRVPWRLPVELRRFKSLTMGHHLIMGRKTFESIGRILPGRTSIVVTRNPDFQAHGCPSDDCLVTGSIEEALTLAGSRGETEAFIIGGGEIYAQCLDFVDRIYLTTVHARVDADTYFPVFDESAWVERESTYFPADENHPYAFTVRVLERAE